MKSEAERRNILYKKYNKILGQQKDLAEFKEPIAILLRRTGKAEFFENVTKGKFEFRHTDGRDRFIMIDPKQIHTFPYGKKSYKGYILHEDFPVPLPDDPVLTTEQVGQAMEATALAMEKWKSKEISEKTKMIRMIIIGIGVIGAIILLYTIFKPDPIPTQIIVQNVTQAVQVVNQTIA